MATGLRPLMLRRPRAIAVRLRAYGPYALAAAALAFLLWCTLTTLARPGLQYDESLFVNAALGGDYAGGGFVVRSFHGVPTMVMPYSGALKSWLYAPLFALFDGSVTLVRLPMIGVLVATIGLAFAFMRRLSGAWPAALLALLMATDPAFMTMAKADWGPVAIAAFLRVAALAAYFAWLRTGAVRWVWLLGASVTLGIFNKVDYLAFAAALAVAAVAVHHRELVALVRRRARALVVPAVVYAGVLLVEYREIYCPAREIAAGSFGSHFVDRLSSTWALLRITMDGSQVFLYMTGRPLGEQTAIEMTTAVAVAAAVGLLLYRASRVGRATEPSEAPLAAATRTTGFFLVLLTAMFVALVGTPDAVGPHHAALLWPLPALLLVSLVAAAAAISPPRVRLGLTAIAVLGVIVLAGSQIRVADAYRSAFASDRSWESVWSTEIFPLDDAVRDAAPFADVVVTADWGFGNQLLALGGDDVRRKLVDAWGTFAGGAQSELDQLAATVLHGRRTIVLLHPQGREAMPGTAARAEELIRQLDPARGVHTLYAGDAMRAYVVDDRPKAR